MAAFYPVPEIITAQTLTDVPRHLWSTKETEWLPGSGIPPPIFLEGPTTDTQGNLFVVDVAYGRILKCDLNDSVGEAKDGEDGARRKDAGWSVLAEYDGEPNGLALDLDGTLIVADYKNGIMTCHPQTGEMGYRLQRKNMERFKGPNDLIVASNGDLYFTDQGQTGMTDPTGLVYRLSPSGKLDTLLSNGVSPNGLVLSPDEKVLYVAQTRENSVWRLPLHKDGTTSKVQKFFQSFGITGPDGLTVDSEGNLFICNPSLLSIFVVTRHGVPLARIVPPPDSGTSVTNCIFGSRPSDRKRLYFTASTTGRICYVDWHCEGATPVRASRTL